MSTAPIKRDTQIELIEERLERRERVFSKLLGDSAFRQSLFENSADRDASLLNMRNDIKIAGCR